MIYLVKDRHANSFATKDIGAYYVSDCKRGSALDKVLVDYKCNYNKKFLTIGFDVKYPEIGVDITFYPNEDIFELDSNYFYDDIERNQITITNSVKEIEKLYKQYKYNVFS